MSAAALMFERGGPSAGAPGAQIAACFADHRSTLVAQSLLFVAGAGVLLWFLASLRSHLLRAEGGAGRPDRAGDGLGRRGSAGTGQP